MTRRDWLRSGMVSPALAFFGCGRKKSPRYQGYALIAIHDSHNVAVIDLSRFARLKEIPVDAAPSWLLAAPSRSLAFVLSADSPSMTVLNLDTLRVERSVPLRGKPQAACVDAAESSLWILLREPDALAEFRIGSGARQQSVRLPAQGADFDVMENQIVVAFPEIHAIGRYAPQSRQLAVSPRLSAAPSLVRLRRDGAVILTGNTADRSITTLEARTLRTMVELPLPLAPRHFCFKNDGGQLFVTGDGMDAVAIVSPFTTEIDQTILAGNAPGSMAVTTAGPQYLFVANPRSGDVTVINIDDRRVLVQIAVGEEPRAVLITPDNEYALVLNEQSGDVAVIRLMNIRQANLITRRSRIASLFTLIAVGSGPVSGAISPRVI